jgi:hypothetical protein
MDGLPMRASGAFEIEARAGIHADLLARVDEEGDLDDGAGLDRKSVV